MGMNTLNDIVAQEPGYLSLEQAELACPMTVTISGVEKKVFGTGAQAQESIALTFLETPKYVTLTKTRRSLLADVVKGDQPLVGTKIKLVVGDFDTGKGKKRMVGIVAPD